MLFRYGYLTQLLDQIITYKRAEYTTDWLTSYDFRNHYINFLLIYLFCQLWGADERRRRLKLLVELGRADMAAEGFVLSQVKDKSFRQMA